MSICAKVRRCIKFEISQFEEQIGHSVGKNSGLQGRSQACSHGTKSAPCWQQRKGRVYAALPYHMTSAREGTRM